MSYGPNPWQQTSWDWRAAGNFIGGGVGSGLLICATILSGFAPALGLWPIWLGLACVGVGLLCVWLEIGRPLRALHVFFNPRTSWMSREAFVALLLFPLGLLTVIGFNGARLPLALSAMAFLYCQSRMLPATRGIPAWRPRLLVSFMFSTGLVEGCGLWIALAALATPPSLGPVLLLVVLVLVRQWLWQLYRRAAQPQLAPRARTALDAGGRSLLFAGTLGASGALVLALLIPHPGLAAVLAAGGGLLALVGGAVVKYSLVTRATYNQGFALPHLPVRGVRSPT